jgi:hypothetical protein
MNCAAAKADKPKDSEPFNTLQEFTQSCRTFAPVNKRVSRYVEIAFCNQKAQRPASRDGVAGWSRAPKRNYDALEAQELLRNESHPG